MEDKVIDEQVISISSEGMEQLHELLQEYFYTKEDIDKRQQEIEEENFNSYTEVVQAETQFQEQLLNELKTVSNNTQISNNIIYMFGIISLLIVAWFVFYKFIKIFI